MWYRLPLNAQLVVAVLLVQALAVGAGAFWLIHWTESSRLDDLHSRLDAQADLIEDMIKPVDGRLAFDDSSEAAREFNSDTDLYYELVDGEGSLVDSSEGPAAAVREELHHSIASHGLTKKTAAIRTVAGQHWLIQSEELSPRGDEIRGTISVAINGQSILDENLWMRRYLSIAALGMLLVSSLGTGFVVSKTTKNIRDFAYQLGESDGAKLETLPNLTPHSAEARMLFTNHAELIASIKRAHEAQRLFIAHASHELKTPIAAAMAALEVTLSRPRDEGRYEETCRDVYGEVKILSRLANVLLDLARLEEGRQVEDECTLADVASRLSERWQERAKESGIQLLLPISHESEKRLPGLIDQWEILLGNLVDNGIKYGKRGGSVKVELQTSEENKPVIMVSDDGRGMSASDLRRLGEIFFRGDESRTSTGSFGLGFAHAQRIAGTLGYHIAVESSIDRGTTVAIRPMKPRHSLPERSRRT